MIERWYCIMNVVLANIYSWYTWGILTRSCDYVCSSLQLLFFKSLGLTGISSFEVITRGYSETLKNCTTESRKEIDMFPGWRKDQALKKENASKSLVDSVVKSVVLLRFFSRTKWHLFLWGDSSGEVGFKENHKKPDTWLLTLKIE